MQIELFYFDGCPSWQKALENLRDALLAEGIENDINLVKIESPEDAVARKFSGSPTIRINGQDLWPEHQSNYSLSCRVYSTPEGLQGWPTIAMFRRKISAIGERKY